jgi:hypothetical protein
MMKIDIYTKGVLTVIAGALVAIVVQNGVSTATAQSGGITKVALCDPLYGVCADISSSGALKVRSDR